ncbi:MAG: S-layer homology domain-containing protein [Clostridia bacterium]|nr:S-layer homology domain-containing protein [Clostridia bacterium]
MKKTIIFVVTAVFVMSTIMCQASPQMTISYDPQDATVSIKGNADGITTVRVTESEIDSSTLSDQNLPLDIIQFMSPGTYDESFGMPENASVGKYTLFMTDSTGNVEKSFVYYAAEQAEEILRENVNTHADKSDYVAAVEENAVALGIDITHPDHSADAIELMYSVYGKDEEDPKTFNENYAFCRAITALSGKTTEEIEEVLRENEIVLGINYDRDYDKNSDLSDSAKESLCSYLSDFDYEEVVDEAEDMTDKENFVSIYSAYSALSSASGAGSWSELKKIYTEDYDFLSSKIVEKNKNYKSTLSTSVFTKMIGYDYKTISDLKKNFDKAVKAVTEKDTQNQGGGGSGGGGGGGSTFVAPPETEKEPIYETVPGVEIKGASSGNLPVFGERKSYPDVNDMAWYKDCVEILAGAGVISGYADGLFRADNVITRAEFAKMIVEAFSVKGTGENFADVPADAWYKPYVYAASGAGIITGYDGRFRPDDNITREDATVILYRIADLLEIKYSGYKEPADINDVSIYAWTAVATFYANDVISGVGGGKFDPKANITRAQAAQLIYNATNSMTEKKKG